MTPKQIALVRASYDRVALHSEAISVSVYESLSRFHPDLRGLAEAGLTAHADQLMSMLPTIVETLDRPARLHPMFVALGQHYALQGMRDEHYDIVGGALLMALGTQLGPAFEAETEAAWTALYAEIATCMIAGARPLAMAS